MIDEDKIERTDMYCTHCSRHFVAELDYGIDGDHVVECPHCGHEHCRTIKNGQITEARWSSKNQRQDEMIRVRRVWKHSVLQIKTSSACQFIRDKWLDLGLREVPPE